MKGLKQCEKGHYFEENIDLCPHCPKQDVSTNSPQASSPKNDASKEDHLATAIYTGPTIKTINQTVTEETPVEMPQKEASNNTFDPLKTTITLAKDSDDDKSNVAAQRRKLRGWLVTFDLISFGTDFKIIEGRNTIGKNADNAITIKDSEVSGSHAMILCRNDVFEISDEMSTNGTTVNGTELGSRLPHILSDGDKIKIGTTNLLFRKAF